MAVLMICVLAVLASASPAAAETVSGPTPYCTTTASSIAASDTKIQGYGEVTCSQYWYGSGEIRLVLSIQRWRWLGSIGAWENMQITTAVGNYKWGFTISQGVTYDCTGTGNRLYRVKAYAYKTTEDPYHTRAYTETLQHSC